MILNKLVKLILLVSIGINFVGCGTSQQVNSDYVSKTYNKQKLYYLGVSHTNITEPEFK